MAFDVDWLPLTLSCIRRRMPSSKEGAQICLVDLRLLGRPDWARPHWGWPDMDRGLLKKGIFHPLKTTDAPLLELGITVVGWMVEWLEESLS